MIDKTIQSKVNRILAATFVVVVAAMAGGLFGYSYLKTTWAVDAVTDDLSRSLPSQIESLIPSFLIPEQTDGVSLVFDKIKKSESLSSVTLVDKDAFKSLVQDCSNAGTYFYCSKNGQVNVAAPIQEAEKLFGYLVKTKATSASNSKNDLLDAILLADAALFIAFAILFSVLARFISRDVPAHLGALLKWVEDDLEGRYSAAPNLHFKELNQLGRGISEVIERHNRSRDQAFVGQLTSGIMHDIKTPLSSLVTAMCLVQEQAKDSAKRLSRLENLFAACESRLPVIGEIIESTLDGSLDIHIEKSAISVRDTVLRSIELTHDLAHGRNAKVVLSDTSADAHESHDSVQLTRVFSNIIKNGLEAISSRANAEIRISLESENGETKVFFDDNGPGLPGDPDKVFRIFRSTKSHGSGLGLLISRRIVESHGGRIIAGSSRELGGARFEVTIPNREPIGGAVL